MNPDDIYPGDFGYRDDYPEYLHQTDGQMSFDDLEEINSTWDTPTSPKIDVPDYPPTEWFKHLPDTPEQIEAAIKGA